MRRWPIYLLSGLLLLSLAGNGVLGWVLWRGQQEYRALARQFVKARQDLAQAQTQAKAPPPEPGVQPQAAARSTAAPAAKTEAATPASAPAKPAAPAGSAAEIGQRYEPGFRTVQADCEGQLGSMLQEAKAEYQTAKTANANVDVAALGAKYMARADRLRRDCDRRVEALLSEMGAALKAAGLPTDLVAEVRQAYQNRIVERQAEIMAKAP